MTNSPSPSNNLSVNEKDWYVIACRIRIQNNKLKEKIIELEDILAEQQEQIELQALKNQDNENLLAVQEETRLALEEEINEYKEQFLQQEEQIETQQENISQLSQELEKIQQQTARLERECSLLQESYNEEQHKLKQIEAENKDLRIRLQRQQRYNLQYKTALDQFLDGSNISNRDSDSAGLGIKSWADSELDNDNISNGSDDFDLNVVKNNDFLQVPPTINSSNSSTESNTDDLTNHKNGDFDSSLSADKADQSENKINKSKAGELNNNNKLFIKLPKFGMKNNNDESQN